MKNLLTNKKGLVLTEVLMAIAILGAMAIASGKIISNGADTSKTSKDYLIAQNLATEGVEIVKAVRNSNWLILPSKKECWRTLDPASNLNRELNQINCNALNMSAGNYYIPIFENNHWLLKNSGANSLDLDAQNADNNIQNNYRISLKQIGNFKGYFQGINSNEKSKYYRNISFLQPTNADQISFEVKVQWLDGKRVKTISKRAALKNWL